MRKIIQQLLLIFCLLKKRKHVQLISQISIRIVKSKNSINDSKRRKKRMALSCSKKLSALLHGIISKHKGDFYCLNCLHSFRTENKLKYHEKVCILIKLQWHEKRRKCKNIIKIWSLIKCRILFMMTWNL